MSSTSTAQNLPNAAASLPAVVWRNWPAYDRWTHRWLPLSAALILFVATLLFTRQAGAGLLAALALLLSMWRTFVPTWFELNATGVKQTRLGRTHLIPWRAVRRAEVWRDGVLLLPDRDASGLNRLRGLYIPWTVHRQLVCAWVEQQIGSRQRPDHDSVRTAKAPAV